MHTQHSLISNISFFKKWTKIVNGSLIKKIKPWWTNDVWSMMQIIIYLKNNPWLLVRNPERPPLVGEVSANFLRMEGVTWSAQRIPMAVNIGFLDPSRYFSIQVAPQLSSQGWVDPVPDPLLLRKSGSVGNRTRDLWFCSQELLPLDHRGGPIIIYIISIMICQPKSHCTNECHPLWRNIN
jgi:hypothetical protein